jgi:hypothetical protein
MTLMERVRTRILGGSLALPPGISNASLPREVTLRQGRFIPRIGGLLARMGGPAAAVTLGKTIVVHPGRRLTPELLAHELEHVRQWREDGLFPVRYALATLRHGYHDNPYEVAARSAASSAANATRTED